MTVSFTLNGRARSFSGDPRASLLEVLRDTYRLTGAKEVCGEGFCGACMVRIDGHPATACLVPMGTLEGSDLRTIEGIGTEAELNPVQQAFVDFDVVQCGMCFPGMVMTLTHFMKDNPQPTREDVKSALTGNICRCTGYERIIDAVMSLSGAAQPVTEVQP